jgi:signal transduction histidine kinase
MRFSDGLYYIAIDDNTYNREIMLNNFAAIIAASVIFLLVMLSYVRMLTLRIIRLSDEAQEIGKGDLDHPITVDGSDEIAMLSKEMDNMRCSVIERMGNEKKAWQANSELITAISHDIRTPMTSLIGYLDLLNDSDFSDPEYSRQFCRSAYSKAMELKDLTDELFRYFLVFGKAELEMNMEIYDGRFLIEQLIAEASFDLSEKGFDVQYIDFQGECAVMTDPLYLKRVVDNLVSNIKKYADKNHPVMVICELRDTDLSVCISNHIAKAIHRVESTKIGIRTCQKIMAHMQGSFQTRSDEIHYAAEFTLPIKKA